jgi:hypothetical protein
MLRSIVIALTAAVLISVAFVPSDAWARRGGGGGGAHFGGGGHFAGHGGFRSGGFRGGVGYRRFGYPYVSAYGYSCWRWQPTPWGLRRVWVCGSPYYPYY